MDNRLLLVKSATLLYRESLLPGRTENSADLVRSVLENVKIADISVTLNKERDIQIALKSTVLEMCENEVSHEYEKQDLLQRLKMNCFGDDDLYESLLQGIDTDIAEASVKRSVVNIRKSISNHFREQQVDEMLMKAAGQFRHNRDKIKDVGIWISELTAQLEPFSMTRGNDVDPAIISSIDIGDEKSTSAAFQAIKDASKGQSILKTGLQDLNDMLQGGLRRGETTVIGALQHKYKTGFSLTVYKGVALYNTPLMRDPTKKPLLLRISFEDDATLNLQFLYQSLKEGETGEKVSVDGISVEDLSAYVKEKMQVNGYHVHLLRVDPTRWTYLNICNYIINVEAQGYEVHMCMLDYLAMIPTTGCSVGPMGSDLRDMFRRMRNFCAPRGISLVTPHQLSTEAKQLIRENRQDFVKEIAEKGYWDKCKTIDNEVDLEIYIHIEKFNKRSYLTIQRGKHRLPTIIDDEKKFVVYPFHDIGGIKDDINGDRTGSRKVGGKVIGAENDGRPDWEFKEVEVAAF